MQDPSWRKFSTTTWGKITSEAIDLAAILTRARSARDHSPITELER